MFKKLLAAHICTKEEAKTRYDICTKCDNLTILKTCKLCGCFCPAKTKLRATSCPIDKWLPIEFKPTDTHYSDDPNYHDSI